jgi:exosome complex component RRP41
LLLQMDGHMTVEEFDRALELAMHGCRQISKLQKEALLNKYKSFEED